MGTCILGRNRRLLAIESAPTASATSHPTHVPARQTPRFPNDDPRRLSTIHSPATKTHSARIPPTNDKTQRCSAVPVTLNATAAFTSCANAHIVAGRPKPRMRASIQHQPWRGEVSTSCSREACGSMCPPRSSPSAGIRQGGIGSSGAAAKVLLEKEKLGGRYTIISGISIKPRRKQLAKASTTRGSKSVPLAFRIFSLASSGDMALRYGRSLVRAS